MTIWNMEITAAESPQTVHIPIEGKYYAIKNTGEHDILVSSFVSSPTEGADDVMKILSGSATIIPVKDGNLYVSAEEDGTYSVSIQDDKVIPWSGGTGSGGDGGGGRTETILWKNEGTTNPYTITLSEPCTNFDEIVIEATYTQYRYSNTWLVSADLIGMRLQINDETHWCAYTLTTSTTLTDYARSGEIVFAKVIGIKYGSGGGGDGGGDNTHYKGTTITPLENGSTTNPIMIDGESYTAVFGDVVVYGYTEFVFDGTAWAEFGRPFDTTPTQGSTNAVTSDGVYRAFDGLGNLASKDSATGEYTTINSVGTLPTLTYDSSAEELTLAMGTLPTTTTATITVG